MVVSSSEVVPKESVTRTIRPPSVITCSSSGLCVVLLVSIILIFEWFCFKDAVDFTVVPFGHYKGTDFVGRAERQLCDVVIWFVSSAKCNCHQMCTKESTEGLFLQDTTGVLLGFSLKMFPLFVPKMLQSREIPADWRFECEWLQRQKPPQNDEAALL